MVNRPYCQPDSDIEALEMVDRNRPYTPKNLGKSEAEILLKMKQISYII